jgi:hypothetical protein
MLWKMDIAKPGKRALYRAIERNNLVVAGKAFDKYVELDALGLITGAEVQWDEFRWRDGKRAAKRPTAPVMLAVEYESMEMLALVVFRSLAAGHNLDTHCRIRPPWPGGWHVHGGSAHICVGCASRCRGRCFANFAGEFRVLLRPTWVEGPNSCESAMHMAVWGVRPDMLRFLLEYAATKALKSLHDSSWMTHCLARVVTSVEYSAYKTVSGPSSKDPAHLQMRQMLAEVMDQYGIVVPIDHPTPSKWRRFCNLWHPRRP